MNQQYKNILKNTISFEDDLFQRLQNKVFSKAYLETALGEYKKDGDTQALLLAMRDVAEAQGGIGKLAKKTTISREHLYDILASKHNPRLDNWLSIISALGFRVRLEPQKKTAKRLVADKK